MLPNRLKVLTMIIKAIINPKSKNGTNCSIESILKQMFYSHNLDIEKTNYPGHATEITRRFVQDNVDMIIVAGGDGTVNEVLNGLIGREIPLGIIPSGTANDLACQHNIPSNIANACEIIHQQYIKQVDLVCVNGHYYATAGGIGLPSEVARIANKIKNNYTFGHLLAKILGSKLYILALICAFLNKNVFGSSLVIYGKKGLEKVYALFLMLNNQPFLGKNFLVSPGAINDDGKIDICLVKHPNNHLKILKILLKILSGKHITMPIVKAWKTKSLKIKTDKPTTFLADGELYQNIAEFKIRIIPQALSLIIPAPSL